MTSTITIPAAAGTAVAPQVIAGVRARIKLIHTRLQDVSMSLTGPDGATFNLQSGAGMRQDIDAVYGGLVSNPVSQFDRTPGVAGEYRILTFVSYHDRPAVTGDWTLTVNDNAHLNYGALDGWSLEFYTSEKFVTISASIPDATEGPLVPGQFMVTRSVVSTQPLTVLLSFGGTARSGEDYQPILSTVVIPAYEASQTIWVTPIVLQTLGGTRTVVATVVSGDGYVAGGGGGGTICNSDHIGRRDTSCGFGPGNSPARPRANGVSGSASRRGGGCGRQPSP